MEPMERLLESKIGVEEVGQRVNHRVTFGPGSVDLGTFATTESPLTNDDVAIQPVQRLDSQVRSSFDIAQLRAGENPELPLEKPFERLESRRFGIGGNENLTNFATADVVLGHLRTSLIGDGIGDGTGGEASWAFNSPLLPFVIVLPEDTFGLSAKLQRPFSRISICEDVTPPCRWRTMGEGRKSGYGRGEAGGCRGNWEREFVFVAGRISPLKGAKEEGHDLRFSRAEIGGIGGGTRR